MKGLGGKGRLFTALMFLMILTTGTRSGAAALEGQMTWALHFSPTPAWFDPAETSGGTTPYIVLYALHDAMIRPSPGHPMASSLAESWSASPDGLVYEFVLRKGVKFHNGDPVSVEDVKFSFERYRGAALKTLKEKVTGIEIPDAARVRFRLKQPWPDFMTFYSSATGAGWIVPKKYVEKVGDEGFKKAPVGAGPYRFVSFTPGVELVLEAFDRYWQKMPAVKRLVFKAIPDETTRLAALKRGEVDIAYGMSGALAEELRRTPGLTLKPVAGQVVDWVNFPGQWEPKSPWHDKRVRLAATYAIDRQAMNQAERLGFARIIWSLVPPEFRVLLAIARLRVRSRQGQTVPCRRGISQRLRRGRLFLRCRADVHGRAGGQLPQRHRHSGKAPANRASGIPERVGREKVPRPHPGTHLAERPPERRWAEGRGVRDRARRRLHLLGAVRRRKAQK